jgi:hypothetical protein
MKMYFLVGLDRFRLMTVKVFVEFELVRGLSDKRENLFAGEDGRVDYTAFFVDSNDVAFCVRNGPVAASEFFDIYFFATTSGVPFWIDSASFIKWSPPWLHIKYTRNGHTTYKK